MRKHSLKTRFCLIYRFDLGDGGYVSVIWLVLLLRVEDEMMTTTQRILKKVEYRLLMYVKTRPEFVQRNGYIGINIHNIYLTGVIYTKLTTDASRDENPETDEIVYQLFGVFDVFW